MRRLIDRGPTSASRRLMLGLTKPAPEGAGFPLSSEGNVSLRLARGSDQNAVDVDVVKDNHAGEVRPDVRALVEVDADRVHRQTGRYGRRAGIGHVGEEANSLPAGRRCVGTVSPVDAAVEASEPVTRHDVEARGPGAAVAAVADVKPQFRQMEALHAMDDQTSRGVGRRGAILGQEQPEAVLIVILRKPEMLHPVPRHDPRVLWVELERRSGEFLVRLRGRVAAALRRGVVRVEQNADPPSVRGSRDAEADCQDERQRAEASQDDTTHSRHTPSSVRYSVGWENAIEP